LECNKSSYWNDSIELANQTNNLLQQNQTILNGDISALRDQANQTKKQSKDKVQKIIEKINSIKNDTESIKRINVKFLKFCLKNNTFIEQENVRFSSSQTQSLVDFALKSLVKIKTPQDVNITTENMFLKQNEVFKKVLKLLKNLKTNLIDEIKNLKNQTKEAKLQLKEDLKVINLEITQKQAQIKGLDCQIAENNENINMLMKKNNDCQQGIVIYDECSVQKGENQKFLDDLKEEEQLIYNLMDLMEKLTWILKIRIDIYLFNDPQ